MFKHATVGAALAVVLAVPISWAGVAQAQSVEPCVPQAAVPASLSAWAVSGSTAWLTSDAPPVDPDGQSGEENPLNLAALGDRDERVVIDQSAYDEEVVVTPGYDEEVFDHWQRYSWTGGPWPQHTPPPFPSPGWQPNVSGDPHGVGVAGAYYRSRGGHGKGDWFYLQAVTKTVHHAPVTGTVHHDAVTHPEYRWALLSRTFDAGQDEVTCEALPPQREPDPDPTPEPKPAPEPEPAAEPQPRAGAVTRPAAVGRKVAPQPAVAPGPVAVPTMIDAGL